jgi:hypothetical protein
MPTNKTGTYCQLVELLLTGFGLVIGLIGHFNTQLVTTLYRSLSHTD